MKRRTRYLFIGLGFLIFGIISPLIVLYVSGFSYDWKTDQLSATGLLSVKTEPSGAEIFLDGEKVGTAPATIRFLKPKDYDVNIRKEGYFNWAKRLEIKSGKVTWASDRLPELHLVRSDPAPVIVAAGVRDFFVGGNFALYLEDAKLVKTKLGSTTATQSTKLAAACERVTASPTENFILLTCGQNNYLYNLGDLSPVAVSLPPDQDYVFGPEDSLYYLDKQTLIKTDPKTGRQQQVASATAAFGFQGNALYRLQGSSAGLALVTSPLYSPNETQMLMDGIPAFKNARLLIARSKEIFLHADSALYRVNDKLEPLLSGITEIGFDAESPALTYTTGFELYAYDFSRGMGHLVARQSGGLGEPQGKTGMGYVLFKHSGNKLQATEIDSRDNVNSYTLTTAAELRKFATDPSDKLVYFMDGSTLKFFRLR